MPAKRLDETDIGSKRDKGRVNYTCKETQRNRH